MRRAAAVVLVAALHVPTAARAQAPPSVPAGPPRILIDQSPRAVEYQLRRLTNDELAAVERHASDPRYRLVYYALLTRTGLARQYRDEALDVLVRMDRASRPQVMLNALGMVPATDDIAAARLIGALLNEPLPSLKQERDAFVRVAEAADAAGVARRGAYAVLLLVDGVSRPVWASASPWPERLSELLRAVPTVVADNRAPIVAAEVGQAIVALLGGPADPGVRVAAVAALGAVSHERGAIDVLARELSSDASDDVRASAVQSLLRIPVETWSSEQVEAVAGAVVAIVGRMPPARRTEPAAVEAIQLGERLSAALPAERGRVVRRDLAALGVRVVRLETIPEQMRFTVKWFAVEAGRRVQIVLFNPDAMPHNVVVARPGSLEEIGAAAAAMSMPADPTVKPFVPDSPVVLAATPLVWEGQTDRLNFTAPKSPGEYVFACTYPGHWARMYGVMLVVESLETWEAHKTFPTDPMTREVLR